MLAVLLLSLLYSNTVSATVYSYGVMIDAGSTGTRAHIYKWSSRETADATIPQTFPELQTKEVEADNQFKVGKGLASHANDPRGAQADIQALIDWVKNKTKSHTSDMQKFMENTPIYLGATAGMRVLPHAQREAVMGAVRETLASSGFKFEPHFARIISGEEEGAFGWLTVNYIQNTLQTEMQDTWVALDLGGASTQFSMTTNDSILAGYFPLDGHYTTAEALYTNSYLYFGVVEAEVLVAKEIQADPYTGTVTHPCFNKGHDGFVFKAPKGNITINGSGDYQACRDLLTTLLRKDTPCYYDNCGLNGVYMPNVSAPSSPKNVLAFSNFAYSAALLGNVTNLKDWEAKTKTMCEYTWTELKNSSKAPEEYLDVICFNAAYAHVLLTEGYGFEDGVSFLVFDDTLSPDGVNQYSTGWALGAMLYQANLLDWTLQEETADPLSDPTVRSTLSILLVALLMLCAYLVCGVWCQVKDKKTYDRLGEPLIA